MRRNITFLVLISFIALSAKAQVDTMYVMKYGAVINKQPIGEFYVDSIMFDTEHTPNDTMCLMKDRKIINKISVNPNDVDSIIFYKPEVASDIFYIKNQTDFDFYKNHTFSAGDVILFKRGETFTGMFAPGGSGNEGAPIVIDAYGSGNKPIINNQGVFHNYPGIAAKEGSGKRWSAFNYGKISAGVFLYNTSYWEVNRLEITNNHGGTKYDYDIYGILYYANKENLYKHIHINACYVHDCGDYMWDPDPSSYGSIKNSGGIWAFLGTLAGTNSVLDGWRVTNNRVERVAGVGMANQSDAVEFFKFSKPIAQPIGLWKGTYYGDNRIHTTGRNGIVVRVSENAVIEYNRIVNSSQAETGNTIYNFNTNGCIMQYNEVSGNNGEGAGERGAFDADYYALNTIIQYNYSHGNKYMCAIMKKPIIGVVVRYNVSINDETGAYNYGFNYSDRKDSAYIITNQEPLENIGKYKEDRTGKILTDVKIYNNTHYFSADMPADIQLFVSKSMPLASEFNNNIFYYAGGAIWNNPDEYKSNYRYGTDPVTGEGFNPDPDRIGFFTDFERNVYVGITPHVTDSTAQTVNPMFIAPGQEPSDINLHTMEELKAYGLSPASPYHDGALPIPDNGGKNILGEPLDLVKNHFGAF